MIFNVNEGITKGWQKISAPLVGIVKYHFQDVITSPKITHKKMYI